MIRTLHLIVIFDLSSRPHFIFSHWTPIYAGTALGRIHEFLCVVDVHTCQLDNPSSCPPFQQDLHVSLLFRSLIRASGCKIRSLANHAAGLSPDDTARAREFRPPVPTTKVSMAPISAASLSGMRQDWVIFSGAESRPLTGAGEPRDRRKRCSYQTFAGER